MSIVHQARILKGMSRADLAKAIGCTVGMVGHIEREERKVSPKMAVAIEKALGIDRALLVPELFQREAA